MSNQVIKARQSLKAFLSDDPVIYKIINVCDLYPIGKSWKKWTDHLGNFLTVHRNKRVTSYTQNPMGDVEKIVTDLYFKSSPFWLSKLSTWAFISFGKSQTDNYDTLYIWFLGRDKRLRFCSFYNKIWLKNEPPLISGIDTLRPILNNINVKDHRKADILHIKGPVAINITRSWTTQWPPKKDLIKEMSQCNQELTNVVKNIIE